MYDMINMIVMVMLRKYCLLFKVYRVYKIFMDILKYIYFRIMLYICCCGIYTPLICFVTYDKIKQCNQSLNNPRDFLENLGLCHYPSV